MSFELILPFFPEELRDATARPVDLRPDDQWHHAECSQIAAA